ncbi:MAG: hypothetical protein ACFC03_02745 [Candidatus Malihini olakiniferum]
MFLIDNLLAISGMIEAMVRLIRCLDGEVADTFFLLIYLINLASSA